ncbi:AAA family ATPase [Paenirhodobacter sp.]|uniref:AAA family ATPase n=1 Tax=Paenirhodobacter sp. TaxID=1965326 RepID=UPI003B503CBF
MMSELGQAALKYAANGLHVFPCAPGDKAPAGWLVRNGQQDATTDAEVIRGWWRREPKANIGVYLKRSGLVAVDPDLYKPNCEWDSFTAGKSIPETLVQKSPRGGRHYIYRAPADAEYAGKLCEGVDIKWDGYILLAPSVVGGKVYEFETQVAPSEAPVWIPRKVSQAAAPGPAIKQGDRSATFFATVRDYCRAGLSPDQIEAACRADPESTGAIKYLEGADRLRQEIDRALNKPDPHAAMVEHGRSLWEGCTHVGGIPRERLLQQRKSRFFCPTELAGLPILPQPWVVEGMVPSNTVTLFSGDGGTGKSLLILQLCVACATGRPWLGMPVKQGRVLFITAEDDGNELHRRLESIRRHEGLDWPDLESMTLRSLAGEDALLAIETKIHLTQTDLFNEIEGRAADEKPNVIVLDTLADMYPANENDRAKVRQFVGLLRGLAIRHECAVILLSHPSLTGLSSGSGTSGSTAWNNSVRSRLYLERIFEDGGHESDSDLRKLTTKKANYGRTGGELLLKWQHGVFVVEGGMHTATTAEHEAFQETVFLQLLDEREKRGIQVSPSVRSPYYAPKDFATDPQARGITKAAFERAMQRLIRSDRLVVGKTEGNAATRRDCLRRAP